MKLEHLILGLLISTLLITACSIEPTGYATKEIEAKQNQTPNMEVKQKEITPTAQSKNESEEIKISVTKTKYDLGDYPNFLIQGGVFKGVLIIGDKAPSADVISITDIAMSLAYSIENNGYPIAIGETKLASELDNIKSKNAILVGSPCINKGIADLFPKFDSSKCVDDYTYSGIPKNKGIILVVENNGNTQIIVTGYSQTNINHASKVLLNYKDYKLDGNLITINEYGKVEEIEKTNTQESKEIDDKISCKDECSADDCSGFEFMSCQNKLSGCKGLINKGIVKGKCGVGCVSNSDCNLNYECITYKCVIKAITEEKTEVSDISESLKKLQEKLKEQQRINSKIEECSKLCSGEEYNIPAVKSAFWSSCYETYYYGGEQVLDDLIADCQNG